MPCNIAVSITKAAVTDQARLGLLTPALIEPVLAAYLNQQYPEQFSFLRCGNAFIVYLAGCRIVIEGGQVTVTNEIDETVATRLGEEFAQLLSALADRAFEQAIASTLGELVTNTQEVVVADSDQRPMRAMVFTVKL